MCGIKMYYELKVVDKFHIPREVGADPEKIDQSAVVHDVTQTEGDIQLAHV